MTNRCKKKKITAKCVCVALEFDHWYIT